MTSLNEDAVHWSLSLLSVYEQMAELKTNAVLQVLDDVKYVESERRYPLEGLLFANDKWRVFYHCHKDNLIHPDEHGHFHFFVRVDADKWSHFTGMSIDSQGQPLQWFMVNRWVTDGLWLERDFFAKAFESFLECFNNESLLSKWLMCLLQLYRNDLLSLLDQRNTTLVSRKNNHTKALEDRDIYTLATLKIQLQQSLENNLLNNTTVIPECDTNENATHQGA